MAKLKMTASVVSQAQLAEGIYDLRLKAPEIASQAAAGQFVSVYSKDGSRLLPRPISLCGIDKEAGQLRLVYRVAGAGTEEFSALKAGDTVDILGPLGNGFSLLEGKKAFLIGGGIGIPPMLQLAKELCALNGSEMVQSVIGYRDSQLFLKDEFEAYGPVYTATEDGSRGTKGNVLNAIRKWTYCRCDLCLRSDPYASRLKGICGREQHSVLDFSGGEDGLRCGRLSCLCLPV